MPITNFKSYLKTKRLGRVFEYHKEIGSTNTRAMQLIQKGADHGLVVLTDFQNEGKGTHGKSWFSKPDQNLTFSTILRTKFTASQLPLVGFAVGLALRESFVRLDSSIEPKLKWPNDVLIGGRKCSGILVESSISSDQKLEKQALVIGIGVNVNQIEFPEELQARASSLRLEIGQPIPTDPLLAEILYQLELQLEHLEKSEQEVLSRYREHLFGLGEMIEFAQHQQQMGSFKGVLKGVDDAGGLTLKMNSEEISFYSGSILKIKNLSFN